MTKKTGIRILITIVIICVMNFSDLSFAASKADERLYNVNNIVYFLTSIMSRGWVIFAKLAGEFLTNKWVYGEVIGLDALLRQWWVIIRNIANFGLGFYFVYSVLLAVIKKDDVTKKLGKKLIRILIGGLGIQFSRFFTAAMVDISTITLAAAGSLPSQIISMDEDAELQENIQMNLSSFVDSSFTATSGMEFELFPKDLSDTFVKTNRYSLDTEVSKATLLDNLMPSAEDVSGPMYYIGFAILKANKLNTLNQSSNDTVKKTLLNVLIQGGTTIIYAIEIAILCVLALMRVIYLWMFIILSPLAILLWCIGNADKDDGNKLTGNDGIFSSLNDQINLKSFFINVFKPTIVVLGMGLALIFSTLMSGVIKGSGGDGSINVNIGGVTVESRKDVNHSTSDDNESYENKLSAGKIFTYTIRHVGKSVLDIMMAIITIVIFYFIIKVTIGISGGKDFVSQKIGKIHDSAINGLESLPVIPVAGYDKYGRSRTSNGEQVNRYMSLGKIKDSVTSSSLIPGQDKIRDEYKRQSDIFDEWFGTKSPHMSNEVLREMERIGKEEKGGNALVSRKNLSKERRTPQGQGRTLANERWVTQFTHWLDNSSKENLPSAGWGDMIDYWNGEANKNLETLFEADNGKYAKLYARYFELEWQEGWEKWSRFKEVDIGKDYSNS